MSDKDNKLNKTESDEGAIKKSLSIDLDVSNITLKSDDQPKCLSDEVQKWGISEDNINCSKDNKNALASKIVLVIKNDVLNLSRQNLSEFPEAWSKTDSIDLVQKLILEGNSLTELPGNFFKFFPLLKWLDLRNNHLTNLPNEGLKNHESLEVLLLENNLIRCLPPELGTINSLKAINVRNNPLEDPPCDVIQSGVTYIKRYLSDVLQGDVNQNNKNNNDSTLVLAMGTDSKVVKKGKKLFSLHGKLCEHETKNSGMKKVLRTQSEKYIESTYGSPISESVLEERLKTEIMLAKQRQKLVKQDAEIQAQKTKENVNKWKDKYKRMQVIKIQEKMSNGGKLGFHEPASMAPFGVYKDNFRMISDSERIFNKMNREKRVKPCNMSLARKIQLEKAKLSHESFLKVKVAEHLESMKNRSYSGMEPQQVMLAAEKDLEIVLKLQEEINKRRKELEFGTSGLPPELFSN